MTCIMANQARPRRASMWRRCCRAESDNSAGGEKMDIARMAGNIPCGLRANLDLDQRAFTYRRLPLAEGRLTRGKRRPQRTPVSRCPTCSSVGTFELLLFSRTGQGCGGGLSAFDGLSDGVEIPSTNFALVLHRRETKVGRCKLFLLQLDEGTHLATGVAMCEFEHAIVEGVEARQRDELEAVTHGPEFALEARNRIVVQVLLPVEGRRAIVCQQLAGELAMNGLGKLARVFKVGCGRFTPDKIGVRCVGQAS